jgi:DNA polymerase III alpha subunit
LTDTGNLHGVVEFVQAAQTAGIKPLIGAEVRVGTSPLLLYAANATGYLNLCRLLSLHAESAEGDETSVAAKQRQPLRRSYLAQHSDGLLAVSSMRRWTNSFWATLPGSEPAQGHHRVSISYYAKSEDRRRYDILQSIRTPPCWSMNTLINGTAGVFTSIRELNSARCARNVLNGFAPRTKLPEPMRVRVSLREAAMPAFLPPDGSPSKEYLRHLVLDGLRRRYVSARHRFRPWCERADRTSASPGRGGS